MTEPALSTPADELLHPTRGDYELEERSSLRRVAGLSTELADVTEVEYRQLRLERVVLDVLVGVAQKPGEQVENLVLEHARAAQGVVGQVHGEDVTSA